MAIQAGLRSDLNSDFEQEPYSYAAEVALSEKEPSFEELEAAVKETPPRSSMSNGHSRNNSELRALGDVIDESERRLPLGSPGLRHTKGRLESSSKTSPNSESFADFIKNESPPSPSTPSKVSTERKTKKKVPSLNEGFPRIVKEATSSSMAHSTNMTEQIRIAPAPTSRETTSLPSNHSDVDTVPATHTTESYADVVKHETTEEKENDLNVSHIDAHSTDSTSKQGIASHAQDNKEADVLGSDGKQSEKKPDGGSKHHALQGDRDSEDVDQRATKQEEHGKINAQHDTKNQTQHRVKDQPEHETKTQSQRSAKDTSQHNTEDQTQHSVSDQPKHEMKDQSQHSAKGTSKRDTGSQRPQDLAAESTTLTNGASYAEVVKHEPASPSLRPENGQDSAATATAGKDASQSFVGTGQDAAPRSPQRKPHKKTSSTSLDTSNIKALQPAPKGTATMPHGRLEHDDVKEEERADHGEAWSPNMWRRREEEEVSSSGDDVQPGTLVYENYHSRSGTNLASVQLEPEYDLSLAQRENKAIAETDDAELKTKSQDSRLVSGRRAGAGWARSAIRWAPLNMPLQRRLQTLAVLAHSLSIAGLLAFFFFLCTVPVFWPILLPYLIYVLLSRAPSDGKLTHRTEWIRRSKLWSLFASYFPARLHRTVELEPTRKYIFGYHPHGIISHGAFAAFTTEALGFGQLFPGITNSLLTLDSNFRVPLYRDWALRLGMASVSRESCENLLSKGGANGEGMGRGITIVIGGARESLDAKPGTLNLVLAKRKGFVKLAVRTGADLVPVLAFGENDMYEQIDSDTHPWIHQGQLFLKKFMGFTVPLFHARGIFNYDVGIMPYRRPINIVVGQPIRTVQSKKPDPEYVDKLHKQYTDQLLHIWEEWKDVFAPQRNCELAIVE